MSLRSRLSICGVYRILNVVNGKIYIGSSVNIYNRWCAHLSLLRRGTHGNKHFQRAWIKYGERSFEVDVVQIVETVSMLLECEQKYIDETRCTDFNIGYNILRKAGSLLNYHHSEETKRKISASHKGKAKPPGFGENLAKSRTGMHYRISENPSVEELQRRDNLRGEKHPGSKLTSKQVAEIRIRYKSGGTTYKELARDYGIKKAQISSIINNKSWKEESTNEASTG